MKCKITFFSQREKKKRICKESDQRLDTISVKGLKIFIECSSERREKTKGRREQGEDEESLERWKLRKC